MDTSDRKPNYSYIHTSSGNDSLANKMQQKPANWIQSINMTRRKSQAPFTTESQTDRSSICLCNAMYQPPITPAAGNTYIQNSGPRAASSGRVGRGACQASNTNILLGTTTLYIVLGTLYVRDKRQNLFAQRNPTVWVGGAALVRR